MYDDTSSYHMKSIYSNLHEEEGDKKLTDDQRQDPHLKNPFLVAKSKLQVTI